jgi:hypothetical protein
LSKITGKSLSKELIRKQRINRELKTMAAVLIGPKEVLVIIIVTAIVVFVVMVRSRKR